MSSTLLKIVLALIFFSSIPRKSDGQSEWCIANEQSPEAEVQKALDWACGNGADCAPIQVDQPCFLPDTVKDHASYAFNSYFQKVKHNGATCDFNGNAHTTNVDPSHGPCKFDSVP